MPLETIEYRDRDQQSVSGSHRDDKSRLSREEVSFDQVFFHQLTLDQYLDRLVLLTMVYHIFQLISLVWYQLLEKFDVDCPSDSPVDFDYYDVEDLQCL